MHRLIHQMKSLILNPKQILSLTWENLVGCTKIKQYETNWKRQKLHYKLLNFDLFLKIHCVLVLIYKQVLDKNKQISNL